MTPLKDDPGAADDSSAAAYVLDLTMPSAVQPVGPENVAPSQHKFVKIDVLDVVNPERVPLSFDVVFRDAAGTDVLLGNVGLYPADRPGHFIVATQDKLRAGGSVQVTLRAQGVRESATIRVSMARIRFVSE